MKSLQSKFLMSWPCIYLIGFKPIGTIPGLQIFNKYFNIASLSEYKFATLNDEVEFSIMCSSSFLSAHPPIKYTLFTIPSCLFTAKPYKIFFISSVPKEKPTKFTKCPLKLLMINSAKNFPVFIADSKAGLKGFY